jgi:hypothetical protein
VEQGGDGVLEGLGPRFFPSPAPEARVSAKIWVGGTKEEALGRFVICHLLLAIYWLSAIGYW